MNALAGLMNPLQVGQMVQDGFMQGRQMRQGMETENALAKLAMNPDDPEARQNLARFNPQMAMQMQERDEARRAQEMQQRRADLPMVLRLLETATDEASYQRNLGVAQQYGIDTSTLPPNFDPQWREQNLATMKLLTSPEGQQILSQAGKQAFDEGLRPGDGRFEARVQEIFTIEQQKTIPVQPGGYVARYNPVTGQAEYVVAPTGAGASDIPAGAIEALKRGEGTPEQFDQMFGPGAAARVMGGGAGNGTGNFR